MRNQSKILLTGLLMLAVGISVPQGFAQNWRSTLPNGMEILIIEDHSTPLIASVIGIKAGSHTETLNSNGISHLLEHLLFDGTETRSRKDLENSVISIGGYFNAFTRKDFVAFEMVVPAQSWKTGLEIQSDQLLHSVIPEKELEKERKVVCEEIAKDYNEVSGTADDWIMQRLFGETGFGLPVIGNYRTVGSIPREDILRFYHSRYVPNRMTAVIIGDVDPGAVMTELDGLYGNMPPGLETVYVKNTPSFAKEGAISVIDRPVRSPLLRIVYPAPAAADPVTPALETAIQIWAGSETSPLPVALTASAEPLAADVAVYLDHYHGFSLLCFDIVPKPEPDRKMPPGDLSREIRRQIEESAVEFFSRPVEAGVLSRLVKRNRINDQAANEKFHHWGREIVRQDILESLPAYFNREEILSSLLPEDIRMAAARWLPSLTSERFCGVWVQPVTSDQQKTIESKGTILEERALPNGLRVICLHDPYAPVIGVHLLTPSVKGFPPVLARMTSEMLDQGTNRRSAEDISAGLDTHGLRIKLADEDWLPFDDYYYSPEYSYFRVEALPDEAESALEMLADMAFHSILPPDSFDRVKEHMMMLAGQRSRKSDAMTRDLLETILSPGSCSGEPLIPPPSDLAGIDLEKLKAYYEQAYRPERCILSVTGNISPARMIDLASRYMGDDGQPSGPVEAPNMPFSSAEGIRRTVPVDSEQAYLRCAVPLKLPEDRIPVMEAAAYILSDMLRDEIRETRGMAYRLGAGLSLRKGMQVLEIGIGTRKANLPEVEETVAALIDEFRKLKFDPGTVRSAANALLGEALRYRQPRVNRSYYLGWMSYLGLDYRTELDLPARYNVITPSLVEDAVRTNVPPVKEWIRVVSE